MRFLSRKSVLFILLILNFSLLNAQGMPGGSTPGGNPPSGEPPAGPYPPAGNENPGNFPPPPPPPKDSDNIIKYRGNRTYSENLPLKIIQTKCTRKEGDLVFIEIFFNQSINPRSVKPSSVLINNNPVLPPAKFLFSKKGDSLKLLIPLNGNSFKMRVTRIRSFDNTMIDPVEFLVEVER